MGSANILHVDLDAFYASVEQLLDPKLAGRPVLVGHGVVLAASYEARAFGVKAPMGVKRALELCPMAVVVPGSFEKYVESSEQVMDICHDFTPLVQQISIDEAFLDVSGSVHILGSPPDIGALLRHRVHDEVGLAISAGIASTKFLAKVASGQAKPNGLLHIDPETELDWLHRLPVSVIWGVGPVTEAKLADRGIRDVGQLASTPPETLIRWVGRGAGHHLHNLAWNRDPRQVTLAGRAGSVGSQSALGRGVDDDAKLSKILLGLSDRVSGRLRKKGKAGRTITIRARFSDMTSATRAVTLPAAVATTAALHQTGIVLLRAARTDRSGPVTLVGVSVSQLEPGETLQLELPFGPGDVTHAGSPAGAAQRYLDDQIDVARARFGRNAVGRASLLLDGKNGTVPDAFRRLAEKD